jgi:hypothetical protein
VRQTRRVIIVFPSEWKWSVYSIDKMPIHHHFLHDYSTLQCPSHTSINSNPYSRPPSIPFSCLLSFLLRKCAIILYGGHLRLPSSLLRSKRISPGAGLRA